MPKKTNFLSVSVLLILIILTGCSGISSWVINPPKAQVSLLPPITSTASLTPFQPMTNTPTVNPPTNTPTHTFTPSATFTPAPTDTPTPTDTPLPTDTPVMEWNDAGHVSAPILLYHHVSDTGYGNRYYVTIDNFRAQMQALKDWGYTTITPSNLVDVILNGGELPNRPVIITFDDGNYDVYENAFPIMHEYGFFGAFYIVANRLESNYFVNPDQLREMINDGWEIGSHAMTHSDLTLDHSTLWYEMAQSRATLSDITGQSIDTFAYPYGKTDEVVTNKVSEYGYRAGMGLGMGWDHYLGTIYYLSRREVQGDYDMNVFKSLLPWSDQ